jgi:hypothetical protein
MAEKVALVGDVCYRVDVDRAVGTGRNAVDRVIAVGRIDAHDGVGTTG